MLLASLQTGAGTSTVHKDQRQAEHSFVVLSDSVEISRTTSWSIMHATRDPITSNKTAFQDLRSKVKFY